IIAIKSRNLSSVLGAGIRHDLTLHLPIDNHTDLRRKESLMEGTTSKLPHCTGVIERYRQYLPVGKSTPIVSLGEGNTPLVYCSHLSNQVGRSCEVFVKNEGTNPTGSFKDRGMTLAVSKAIERGARLVICASTGNTSASAAAYATRAGVLCAVVLPEGHIALGKLAQALIHGARVVPVRGNFD